MGFILRNKTITDIDIGDLGIRLNASSDRDILHIPAGEIKDSVDLATEISAGNIAILDPSDDTTELGISDSQLVADSANVPHYSFPLAAKITTFGIDPNPIALTDIFLIHDGTDNLTATLQSMVDDLDIPNTITANGFIVRTADDTYASRSVIGTTNEVAIVNGDGVAGNPTIGIADDPVLPGTEGVVPPVGTTAQRPGTPDDGELRFNSTTSLMEYYNGTSWVSISGTGIGPGTIAGSIVGYHFLLDKFSYGSWLGTTTKHISSDETQYVMPFGAEIVAITYSCNKDNSDIDLFVEVAANGSGNTNSTAFNWTITNARVARISTLTGAGGPSGIVLTAGTKIAVFGANPGGGTEPGDVVVSVYIQWTDEVQEEDSETWNGNFS